MPKPLPDPIPGGWLVKALKATDTTQIALAAMLRHSDSSTVSRWCRAGSGAEGAVKGLTVVQWYACLMALGLPKDWRPPGERRKR